MGGAGNNSSPAIKPINKAVIHRICSGQVILDLASAVKELVENSLDAGSTCVEVSLKEHGEEWFKVVDNGCGISPNNFQALALKHHTSKLSAFSDLHSLTTFGFRGEALSSLCALGNLSVETRTESEPTGTHLTFDHSGAVLNERKTARQVGTTVTVERLFCSLPVRSKEFKRNVKREYGKLISLLNAYALIAKGVRLLCTNTTSKGSKSVVLKTQGSKSLKDNLINIFGISTFQCLVPLNLTLSEGFSIEGFISKSGNGNGRNSTDRQFFYVNNRPVDLPKVGKMINELYKSSNSKQYPIAVLNFCVPTESYDVNVTPDKRKVFFSSEGQLMVSLRETLETVYSPDRCVYSINSVENPKSGAADLEEEEEDEDEREEEFITPSKTPSSKNNLFTKITPESGNKTEGLSAYRFVNPQKSSDSSEKFDKNSSKTNTEDFRRDGNPSRSSGFVQSSLSSFVSVSKRKFESESETACNPLSEVPILRKASSIGFRADEDSVAGSERKRFKSGGFGKSEEFGAVRKSNNCIDSSASLCTDDDDLATENESEVVRKNSCTEFRANAGTNDDVCEKDEEECGLIRKNSCTTFKASVGTDGSSVKGNERKLFRFGISEKFQDPTLTQRDNYYSTRCLEKAHEAPNLKVGRESDSNPNLFCKDAFERDERPKTMVISYPPTCFSMDELVKRRQQRLSFLFTNKCSLRRTRPARNYAAATMESSQPVNEEEKARSLAAAVVELERFFKKEDFARMQVIGQFNLGFIVGKIEQDLFIVDQHAADEKYNFERLSQSTTFNLQPLLQPIRMELSPEEEVVASMHMDIIRKNGFVVAQDTNASPGHQMLLKAVPFSKNITFGPEDLKELISALVDGKEECAIISSYKLDTSDSICPSRVRAMLASRACRTSCMVGDALTKTHMQKILSNLATLRSPWNCPHGRPTMRHLVDLTTIRNEVEMDICLEDE
ncbi:hypothetical protein LUZ60_015865 [Juncus effusus]|nr:hypothetical protein LUZ60_015865 [Juncus effusus]